MTGWIVLLIILGLLLTVLLTPAGVRFTYDQGEMSLDVRFGPIRRRILPGKEKPEKPEKPEKEKKPGKKRQKPPKGEKEKKEEKEKPPKAKISREQILYALEKLPPILGRALGGTRRRVRIKPLKVHLLVAGYDPADTAVLYGKLEAALSAGLPVLRRAVRIRDEDIQLFLDFSQEQMDCIAELGATLRPWDLLAVGGRAGISLLRWFQGFRRLASPAPAKEPEAPSKDAGEAA